MWPCGRSRSINGRWRMRAERVDSTQTVTHVSLCAGYGGIDLGLSRVVPALRTVAFSEIEAYACANLVAKMEAGHLDPAPIWTDLKTFPWDAFRDRVDILSGGYPCQPFSAAGKRLGKDDPRHLWPFIADGIGRMRPGLCFFENVGGHVSLGLSTVISDLEELGYRVAPGLFSSAEVGGWHERQRVYIMAAHPSRRRIQGGRPDGQQGVVPLDFTSLPDALSSLPPPCLEQHNVRCAHECRRVDADGEELYCPECRTDYADCVCVGPHMDEDFDYQEDSKGKLTAHTKPGVSGDTDGPSSWVDRMRLIGNGVDPRVAQHAWVELSRELNLT